MPTTQIAPSLVQSFKDSNGNPLAGGLLYTFVAGTSTPQTTYTDATGTAANANPVVLNSRGEAPVWLTIGQSYKFVLYDAFSTLIYSVDQIAATNPIGAPIALSATGITGAAASGANADITSLAGPVSTVNGQTLLHLNDIVNGNFVIAQAGTSFAATNGGAYDLDGWLNANSTTAVFTVAQVAGSTAGRLARQATVTTAKPTIAAGDLVFDGTRIEGYNIEKYVGNTFTVGFRAKVPVAGIHCVALRNSGGDRSYVVEINFPVANVYQNCSFTVVGGLTTAGTWNYTNGVGLEIDFSRLTGTTFQTTPNAWNTGNFMATFNQVNDCATVGNVWAMEKVTLNLGTVAAVSEIDVGDELRRCQRQYRNKLAPSGTGSGTLSRATAQLSPPMRAVPTIAFASTCTWNDATAIRAFSSMSTNYSTTDTLQVDIVFTVNASPTGAAVIFITNSGDVSASARL